MDDEVNQKFQIMIQENEKLIKVIDEVQQESEFWKKKFENSKKINQDLQVTLKSSEKFQVPDIQKEQSLDNQNQEDQKKRIQKSSEQFYDTFKEQNQKISKVKQDLINKKTQLNQFNNDLIVLMEENNIVKQVLNQSNQQINYQNQFSNSVNNIPDQPNQKCLKDNFIQIQQPNNNNRKPEIGTSELKQIQQNQQLQKVNQELNTVNQIQDKKIKQLLYQLEDFNKIIQTKDNKVNELKSEINQIKNIIMVENHNNSCLTDLQFALQQEQKNNKILERNIALIQMENQELHITNNDLFRAQEKLQEQLQFQSQAFELKQNEYEIKKIEMNKEVQQLRLQFETNYFHLDNAYKKVNLINQKIQVLQQENQAQQQVPQNKVPQFDLQIQQQSMPLNSFVSPRNSYQTARPQYQSFNGHPTQIIQPQPGFQTPIIKQRSNHQLIKSNKVNFVNINKSTNKDAQNQQKPQNQQNQQLQVQKMNFQQNYDFIQQTIQENKQQNDIILKKCQDLLENY